MAEIYWISYSIGEKGNAERRYQHLLAAVHEMTQELWWTEMSNFILFQSDHGIDEIAEHVRGVLDPEADLAVLVRQDAEDGVAIGAVQDVLLFELMPNIRRQESEATPA